MDEATQIAQARRQLDNVVPILTMMKSRYTAESYYSKLYELVDTMQDRAGVQKEIQCGRQQCSFCCHDLIAGSTDEIKELTRYVKETGGYINTEVNQSRETWNGLTFAQTACPLLKDGRCTQYERRPLICRKYNIRKGQDPRLCAEKGSDIEEIVLLPITTFMLADVILSKNQNSFLNFELLGNDSLMREPLNNGKFFEKR